MSSSSSPRPPCMTGGPSDPSPGLFTRDLPAFAALSQLGRGCTGQRQRPGRHAARPSRRCHHRNRGAGMTGVFLPGEGGAVVFSWLEGR